MVSKTIFSRAQRDRMSSGPVEEFANASIFDAFDDQVEDRAFMTDWFRRWQKAVIAELPPERLLIHQSRDGWGPLCAFLEVPVPAEPYPRVNSTDDMLLMFTARSDALAAADEPPPDVMEQVAKGYAAAMKQPAFGATANEN